MCFRGWLFVLGQMENCDTGGKGHSFIIICQPLKSKWIIWENVLSVSLCVRKNMNANVLKEANLHINTAYACRCAFYCASLCSRSNTNAIMQMQRTSTCVFPRLCTSTPHLSRSVLWFRKTTNTLTVTPAGPCGPSDSSDPVSSRRRRTALNTNNCLSAPAAIKDSQLGLGGEEERGDCCQLLISNSRQCEYRSPWILRCICR